MQNSLYTLTSDKTFSKREGIEEEKKDQNKSVNDDLKHSIWNVIFRQYLDVGKLPSSVLIQENSILKKFFESILYDFFKIPADKIINGYLSNAIEETRELYYNLKWNEMYDLIEFLAQIPSTRSEPTEDKMSFVDDCNIILERESSNYKFIGKKITKIN